MCALDSYIALANGTTTTDRLPTTFKLGKQAVAWNVRHQSVRLSAPPIPPLAPLSVLKHWIKQFTINSCLSVCDIVLNVVGKNFLTYYALVLRQLSGSTSG